jgi:beta-ureidopropionase / N-carbamoyl-L-amino-acid hydrolase
MIYSLAELNALSQEAFTEALGSIFEQTPAIAAQTWNHRPFATLSALHRTMATLVRNLSSEQQLALIRAHPDLGSKAKMAEASVQEQASAGLDRLTPTEYEQFHHLNQSYQTKFGFPFIIAVKNHTKASILEAFVQRLQHTVVAEQERAIAEIIEIARFRLLATVVAINGDRLHAALNNLAEIGKLPNSGVSRVAFTPEDLQARTQVQAWMVEAGMTVRIDAAGNIIGRYPGRSANVGALATGSHIDTVPVAGRYDGCLGVLAGIELVRVLQERSLHLNHPIEVIVFTDEERSVIGSKAMAGEIAADPSYYARLDGTPIQTCLATIGGDWSAIATAKRQPQDIAAFIELHVEQGGVLEHHQQSIGIVTGIVGQHRFAVTITGRPNHAGTTPMPLRKDALLAASKLVLAVNQIATENPGDQVATVGYLTVLPNATNTVAGKVDLRIDMRDLSEARLDAMVLRLKQEIEAIATQTGTEIELQQTLQIRPTLASETVMTAIAQVCQQLQLSAMQLPSRAGHDAQEMGRFTEMGMIFVPSQGGISHSDEEYTSPESCTQGAEVLLQNFLRLDAEYGDRHS